MFIVAADFYVIELLLLAAAGTGLVEDLHARRALRSVVFTFEAQAFSFKFMKIRLFIYFFSFWETMIKVKQ